jgi:formyltetrahydrofolate deformylase
MTAVLLLSCPDQRGVVAATAQFIADYDGNIVHAEQHVDPGSATSGPMFFQRVEFELDGFGLGPRTRSSMRSPRRPNGSA